MQKPYPGRCQHEGNQTAARRRRRQPPSSEFEPLYLLQLQLTCLVCQVPRNSEGPDSGGEARGSVDFAFTEAGSSVANRDANLVPSQQAAPSHLETLSQSDVHSQHPANATRSDERPGYPPLDAETSSNNEVSGTPFICWSLTNLRVMQDDAGPSRKKRKL